jgi:hypothetical protein
MTVEEYAEIMCQKIWLDVSEPMLPLKDRYRLMKDRIMSGLNTARTEGALEENTKWEQWTGQSRHPHPMCKSSIPDQKEADAQHKMVEEFTKSIDNLMIEAINFRPGKVAHKETATERQERILKDKRDYSFNRFMFGRMNADNKRRKP